MRKVVAGSESLTSYQACVVIGRRVVHRVVKVEEMDVVRGTTVSIVDAVQTAAAWG